MAVRIIKEENIVPDGFGLYVVGFCLSGDTKPTANIVAGIMTESDTGATYFFEEGTGWTEQFSFQSS